ncbi:MULTISPECIES: archaellin/type IV pilin N-terminal domain-containing protein [Halomicrobium]|uniref:Flagellin n=2 Tax=Halomicrobium mukohataei TaxID=57705 RepID=C7NX14_HALMD|nr:MULTISPECIES: archaellin/type IV pilin N-terminal domain-containing protein [Halomicrobium]ACV46379.1 flagellin [Halomicrobium mukohataei DSM 12286]QCD64932.1 flagellin [Halomicrobium mukohataei]QFR19738.1 flagellin [Halomicrobium sp. ZPS1]
MIELFDDEENDRGQVGIGTLIVFIAMVLVAAIAAGVLINTAGFLQSSAEESGEQSSAQVTNRLQVVNAVGEEIIDADSSTSGDAEVARVILTVKKAPGADNVDLETTTAQWVSDGGTFNIVEDTRFDNTNHDAAFLTGTFQDDDASISDSTVLNDPADRATMTFETTQLSSTNSGGATVDGGNDDALVSDSLSEGSTATVKLNTQAGGETTATLVVPESLSGKSAVSL